MEEITVDELKGQLTETVALLAADATEQRAWCEKEGYHAGELIQGFHDFWFVSRSRLSEAVAIDRKDEAALDDLVKQARGCSDALSPSSDPGMPCTTQPSGKMRG